MKKINESTFNSVSVLLLILLSVFLVILSGCLKSNERGNITEQDAISFVLDDLKAKYPDAELVGISNQRLHTIILHHVL
ncbi:MAG: hypothetical protein QW112_03030 [Candidatus Micrarchaeia archaeon]